MARKSFAAWRNLRDMVTPKLWLLAGLYMGKKLVNHVLEHSIVTETHTQACTLYSRLFSGDVIIMTSSKGLRNLIFVGF